MSVSTSRAKPIPPLEPTDGDAIPALKAGDRLTRDKFERRYDAMPDLRTKHEGNDHVHRDCISADR
jgi:hypothetical protein